MVGGADWEGLGKRSGPERAPLPGPAVPSCPPRVGQPGAPGLGFPRSSPRVSRLGLGELGVGCACAYVCVRVYLRGKEGWSGDTLFPFPVFNNWILTLRPASLTAWAGRGAIFLHHSHLCSLFTECKAGDLGQKGGRESARERQKRGRKKRERREEGRGGAHPCPLPGRVGGRNSQPTNGGSPGKWTLPL